MGFGDQVWSSLSSPTALSANPQCADGLRAGVKLGGWAEGWHSEPTVGVAVMLLAQPKPRVC